jgi:hypothetical protein
MKPEMGKWYWVSAEAVKQRFSPQTQQELQFIDYHEYAVHETITTRTEWGRDAFESPIEAMYIGTRYVYDGNYYRYHTGVFWEHGWDDPGLSNIHLEYQSDIPGDHFRRTETHIVFVFVRNQKENPFLVFPEDVEEAQS